jgi:hypothetical protein
MTADAFNEVVVATNTGSVIKTEKITDADDLKDATEQKTAMEKASTLTAATERALQQNIGSRGVSIFPELQGGNPVATVTLLSNGPLHQDRGEIGLSRRQSSASSLPIFCAKATTR